MAILSYEFYCVVVTMIVEWVGDDQNRLDRIEQITECCRNILSTTGVQRHTRPFADMWIVLSMVKIHSCDADAPAVGDLPPVPISQADPSPVRQVLSDINKVPYRGRILQGCSISLEFAREMKDVCKGNAEVVDWMWDFEMMMDAALHVFH